MMSTTLLGLASLALLPFALAHSKDDLKHMGALGLMWPPDREWSEDEARTEPCGSPAGVVNRTEYPLSGASLALEQKDVAYDIQVYISLSEDPGSNGDFELLSEHPISSLDFDHVCVTAPSLPASASADQNATLQLRYVAEYLDPDHHHKRHTYTNETFYVCADVTLVPADVFTFEIPCFNVSATEGHRGADEEEEGHHHDDDEEEGEEEESNGGGGGLAKEAIAGIVIGCVVGVGILATLGWYLWRRDRREAAVAREIVETGGK